MVYTVHHHGELEVTPMSPTYVSTDEMTSMPWISVTRATWAMNQHHAVSIRED